MNYHVGDKIRHIRESKGHSVDDLSKHLGLKSQNSVLCIEFGRKSPDLDRLGKIADFFEMTILDILSLELPEDYKRSERNCRVSLLGQKIKKAREELGQSLEALADATKISQKMLKRVEIGTAKNLSDKDKVALSDSLNISLKYLLDDEMPVDDED